MRERLHGAASTLDLLARAVPEACRMCGFARGVVLQVEAGRLTAADVPVTDAASDALRRRALGTPIALAPETPEMRVVRRAEGAYGGRVVRLSTIAQALDLDAWALAAIAPTSRALALIVLDRPAPDVDEDAQRSVDLFAHLLGASVERTVLRSRLRELSTELRYLTSSALALLHEAIEAPITLASDYGHGPVFLGGPMGPVSGAVISELLTDRERAVMGLMVEGYSNKEIGDRLHVAPGTVKDHVARLLVKLGARNRVDAVVRYLRYSAQDPTLLAPPTGGATPADEGL
jgi:DNA-binding CsgD family transcriptional regulator